MFKENYDITVEEAKQMKEYKYIEYTKLEDIRNQLKNNTFDFNTNVPIQIEFGNIDIELTILDNGQNDNTYDMGYYICTKYEDNEWESYGYSDTIVNLEVDNIEKVMFEDLMKFAKKNNLYWSKFN